MPESFAHPVKRLPFADSAKSFTIVGELDDPSVGSIGELLAGGIAGASKTVIMGAAHLPHMDQPVEFNRIVLEFLSRQ